MSQSGARHWHSAEMIELEAKFWPVDRISLAKKLDSLGRLNFSSLMSTRYFLFPEVPADCLFRLREIGHIATLTSKGPRQHKDVKARDEYETLVSNSDSAVSLIEFAGGIQDGLPEERWRQEWKLPRGITVVIDRLPDARVPDYCEIEGPDGASIFGEAEELGLGTANRGSETFNELAALFGVSSAGLHRPLPESMTTGLPRVGPSHELRYPQGDVAERKFFMASLGDILVERMVSGGRARWSQHAVDVSDTCALGGFLSQAGIGIRNGDEVD